VARLSDAELAEFAAKVAGEFGMKLDAERTAEIRHCAYITGWGRTYSLHQHREVPDGMVRIAGVHRRTNYPFQAGERPHIQVSISRGPAAVVREIRRRLAPAYEEALSDVAGYDAQERRVEAARLAVAGRLEGMFPAGSVHRPSHCQDAWRSELVIPGKGREGGWAKLSGRGGELELEGFRVPVDVGERMLAVYAEYVATLPRDQVK
jgi:hypothetical protein